MKLANGLKIESKARGNKGFDGGIGIHIKIEVNRATEDIETTAETDTTAVTVHTLPKHRMSLVMQGNRYTARIPWKGCVSNHRAGPAEF